MGGSQEPTKLELSLHISSLLVHPSAYMYKTNGLSMHDSNSLPPLSPKNFCFCREARLTLAQPLHNFYHSDSPLEQWISMSHTVLSPPFLGDDDKEDVKKKRREWTILKHKGSSLGREEEVFLARETAITKISRLKKVTCLLGNCEQFIQARTQSKEWQAMRLERWVEAKWCHIKEFGCCPTEHKEPKVFKQRGAPWLHLYF